MDSDVTTASEQPASIGRGGHAPDRVDVVVVGGGLAGLTAANVARSEGASVLLVDAHPFGGRARTVSSEHGAVLNGGPRALYRGGAAARVLDELGVSIAGATPDQRAYRVVRDGHLHLFPSSAPRLLATRAVSVGAKAQLGALMAAVPRLDPAALAHLSVDDWIASRRLGDAAAELARAIARLATYSDDTTMSAEAVVVQLQLVLGAGVSYLDRGWQQLVDALVQRLSCPGGPATTVRERTPVRSLRREGGDWLVELGSARSEHRSVVRCAAVVLAPGGPDAAASLSPVPVRTDGLGPPVRAACLELVLPAPPPVRFLLGVDTPTYLSLHGPPARLGDGLSVVHVLRYGTTEHRADRDQLWRHARCAGIDPADVLDQRFLAAMTVSGGMPRPGTGGLAGRPAVELDDRAGLYLAGDWVGDEGLLADAAMSSGHRAGALAAASARRCALRSPR